MPKPPVTEVINTMYEMYKDMPETELQYTTPFQLLIAVIMSAQTTDKQVNVVTQKLYKIVKTPYDIITLWEEKLGEYIRFVGLWKAKKKNIYKTALQLTANSEQITKNEEYRVQNAEFIWSLPSNQQFRDSPQQMQSLCGYWIPNTIKWITELPWVGIKTAKVVLAVLYGQAWIAVDTHVHRVSKRLGRVRWKTITPDTTSKRLEKKIPNPYKRKAHRAIIYFGRYHCTAKKPKCESCPFNGWCPEGKRNLKFK